MLSKVQTCRGISLIEVLISIGVVSIGLLGVVSLIPVASQQAETGARNDRKANVGRRSFREFQVRGFNNPGSPFDPRWIDLTTNGVDNVFFDPTGSPPYLRSQPYYLFPLGLAAGALDASVPSPAVLDELVRQGKLPRSLGKAWSDGMVRLSLESVPDNGQPDRMTAEQAEEVFVFQDDLEFEVIPASGLPIQTFLKNSAQEEIKRYATGNFSWAAMMTPDWNSVRWVWNEVEDPETWDGVVSNWIISTVIMYRRNAPFFEPALSLIPNLTPSAGQAGFYSDGISGGDVRLQWISDPLRQTSPGVWVTQETKGIKAGDWVMLAHDEQRIRLRQFLPRRPRPTEFKWYRVTGTSERDGDFQDISLVGPDWDPNWGSTQPAWTWLIWIPEVVAVYTKTMQLEIPPGLQPLARRTFPSNTLVPAGNQ